MTYPPIVRYRHRPRSTTGRALGTATHPDIRVLETVTGASVPVAAGVVRHVGDV